MTIEVDIFVARNTHQKRFSHGHLRMDYVFQLNECVYYRIKTITHSINDHIEYINSKGMFPRFVIKIIITPNVFGE